MKEEVRTGKKQQQEQLRATRPIVIRALSIFAAVAALAVTAAPVGSAAKAPPGDTAARSMFHGSGGNGPKFLRSGAAKAPRPAGDGHSLFGPSSGSVGF